MEIQNSDLEQVYAGTFRTIEVGSILTGKVVSKTRDSIVIDIGYKSEGFIPTNEFTPEEIENLHEGSEVEVLIKSIRNASGQIILSKKQAMLIRAQQKLQKAYNSGTYVEGKIMEKTKGGFIVDISGGKAFLPGSQYDIKPLKSFDKPLDKKCQLKVINLDNTFDNVIVSRRAVIEEEKKREKEQTLANIEKGAFLKGKVKNITDYGVFIDLGEIDGLLHISDISWGRINHPSEVFSVGDEVEAVILDFNPEAEKITLGYKQKKPDPWSDIEKKYHEGKKTEGKVVGLTNYGAFIEVEEGIEGLVHITELEWGRRPKHPSKYLEIGDIVDVVVLKVDKDERRISFGLKQLKPKPWEVVGQKYSVGQKVTGKIKTITEFGVFVEMPEGVDAMIHISDISWTKHVKHPSDVFQPRQKVEAVVLYLKPEKEKMLLGIKQLEPDPWTDKIPNMFKLGDEVNCRILRINSFGMFVEIENMVEGLIYASEIVKKDGVEYKENEEIQARIIRIDPDQRKIGLSMMNTVDIDSP